MRIVYLCNNWVGWQVLRHLQNSGDEVVCLVIHPEIRRKCGCEILATARLAPDRILEGTCLREPAKLSLIAQLRPELAVSVYFGYLLKADFLSLFPKGCVNLHPALLPHNRGAYPNVWSIIDGTPAGVTLHYVDEGIDTGDVIAQQEVAVGPADTGATLYRKLELASVELFVSTWPSLKEGSAPRRPQPVSGGTSHRVDDVRDIDEIDLDRRYTARELINLLRARTFPPYRGAYFVQDGRRIYINVDLTLEDPS